MKNKELTVKGERLGEFEELVLLCVRQLGQGAHGSAVQDLLEEGAGRQVTLGAIYAALDRAQRKGLIDSWLGEPTAVRGGRAKRHYAVTPEGEDALRESRAIRERLWTQAASEART
jgi:PadR family transcriptional regulator PadR